MLDFKVEKVLPIADIVKKYYNGRKIVLYGDSYPLRKALKIKGLEVSLVVTDDDEKITEKCPHISTLKGKASEYYIAIPNLPKEKFKDNILSLGYVDFKDFVFCLHEFIIKQIRSGDYDDEYGNHIHSRNCVVELRPEVYNANIDISSLAWFSHNPNRIENKVIITGSNANVYVGDYCRFTVGSVILAGYNSKVFIGEKGSFLDYLNITVESGGRSVHIGDDCMFSYEIKIYAGDGHAIFSTETMERTNEPCLSEEGYTVDIGNHVWVGVRSTIVGSGRKNTVIGNSSIVGAGSIVKGKFPNNCVLAGNPAKLVKKNVTWSRNILDKDISLCGEENINLTELE